MIMASRRLICMEALIISTNSHQIQFDCTRCTGCCAVGIMFGVMSNGKRITKSALREALHSQLSDLGFIRKGKGYDLVGEPTKAIIRNMYSGARARRQGNERSYLCKYGHLLAEALANGNSVVPERIDAELVQVSSGTPEAALFRLATLLWSVPVSRGFGRRLRFLVRDRQNSSLIGVFALGDPVFNLTARDDWIGWDAQARKDRLIHVMDAYVVGALPPYTGLLGGKLVAALVASQEVRTVYNDKYLARTSIISGIQKNADLVLVTTTSALGRSSMYNRLHVPDGPEFVRLGFTKGFGHFHLEGEVFDMMRAYLKQRNHPYASGHGFGMGPSWRLRVVRAVLQELGLNGDSILKHGIKREVFAAPVAANWREVLQGEAIQAEPFPWNARTITQSCIERWIAPRAKRRPEYAEFRRESVLKTLGIAKGTMELAEAQDESVGIKRSHE